MVAPTRAIRHTIVATLAAAACAVGCVGLDSDLDGVRPGASGVDNPQAEVGELVNEDAALVDASGDIDVVHDVAESDGVAPDADPPDGTGGDDADVGQPDGGEDVRETDATDAATVDTDVGADSDASADTEPVDVAELVDAAADASDVETDSETLADVDADAPDTVDTNPADSPDTADADTVGADASDADTDPAADGASVIRDTSVDPSPDVDPDCPYGGRVCNEVGTVTCAPLTGVATCRGMDGYPGPFVEAATLEIDVPDASLRFGEGWGVAAVDMNGDGDLDIVTGGPDGVHVWLGDGAFGFDELEGAGAAGPPRAMSAAPADVDGDGDLDLLVTEPFLSTRGDGGISLLLNDGTGRFTLGDFSIPEHLDSPSGIAWGDYDADGDLDVYVLGFYGAALFRNDGAGTFSHVADPYFDAERITTWQGSWADLDFDGDLDFFAQTDKGYTSGVSAQLVRNDGPDGLTDVLDASGITERLDGMGLALADFNGDDLPDMLVSNTGVVGPGQVFYASDGPLQWTQSTRDWGFQVADRIAWGLSAFDWDNDGDPDVALGAIVSRASTGPWLGENVGGYFIPVGNAERAPTETVYGTAVADFDGDGRLDLVWATQSGEVAARVYRNVTETSGGYLRVRLHGRPENRQGFGATVWVNYGDGRDFRYVLSGTSYMSTDEPVAHFGLGDIDTVYSVRVSWPDGERTSLVGPFAPGTVLDAIHPMAASEPDE